MNKVDGPLYKKHTNYNPCDAFLAAVFIDASAAKKIEVMGLGVELSGKHTRGQCVSFREMTPNVRVIQELDFEVIKRIFLEVAQYKE